MTNMIWIFLVLPGILAADQSTDTTVSYGDYHRTLQAFVNDMGMVNYKGLKQNPDSLDSFLDTLSDVPRADYMEWAKQDKIAFWINAYNALTLKVIIDHYPIKASWLRSRFYPENSIRQIPGAWDEITFEVMERKLTLEQIEHEILRVKFEEPRIHAALVCAAMGCPPLRNEPYTGKKLNDQLNEQMRLFLANRAKFKINREKGKVYLSPIFEWFAEDFVNEDTSTRSLGQLNEQESAVIRAIAPHLADPFKEFLLSGNFKIKYLEYDWSLNEQPQ